MRIYEVDASELHTASPHRSPKKKAISHISPIGKPSNNNPRSKEDHTISLKPPVTPRRINIFGGVGKREAAAAQEELHDTEQDLSILLSPQFEQDILKKHDRKVFSPVRSIKRLSMSLTKTFNSSLSSVGSLNRGKEDDNDDNSDSDSDDDDDGSNTSDDTESPEKKLSEEDVMVLLCREFQLMDDDEDNDYDDDEDSG
jgi:hypothetical protein